MTAHAPFLACLLLLPLAACAEDAHLAVAGHARVELSGGSAGFEFPARTRLEVGGAPVTGSCVLRGEGGRARYMIDAELRRPGASGLTSLRLEGTDRVAVTATLNGESYRAVECAATVYMDARGGVAGVDGECALSGPDMATATAVLDLHFDGCTVIDL